MPRLLARRTVSGYDEAVAHLAELRDLTLYRKQRDVRRPASGCARAYVASVALQRRLRDR